MWFLADESCDFAVVRALRSAGHGVSAVRDEQPGAADEDVIKLAVEQKRVLLTEDKDFGQLVFASSIESPGVLLLRFPATARQAMAKTVVDLIEKRTDNIKGRFVVVQPGRIRITRR